MLVEDLAFMMFSALFFLFCVLVYIIVKIHEIETMFIDYTFYTYDGGDKLDSSQ